MDDKEKTTTENNFVDFIGHYSKRLTNMIIPARQAKMFSSIQNTYALRTFWEMRAQQDETSVPILEEFDRLQSDFNTACISASLEELETTLNIIQRVIGELNARISDAKHTIEKSNAGYRTASVKDSVAARNFRDAIDKSEKIVGDCEAALIVQEQLNTALSNLYNIKKNDKAPSM